MRAPESPRTGGAGPKAVRCVVAVRLGPWAGRKYFLDKMTLGELVQAYFTHYAIMSYLALSVVAMARHSSDPSNTWAYCPVNWSRETDERTISSISAWVGQMSRR